MAKQGRIEEAEMEERVGCFTLLRRFIATTLVCVLVLLIGAYFFVGTEGFRSFLVGRLEAAWGAPFQMEHSQGLLRGSVRLDGVEGGAPTAVVPSGFRAAEVVVSGLPFQWAWTGGLRGVSRLGARDWQLVFVQDAEGDWTPNPLLRAHDWLNEWLQLGLQSEDPAAADVASLPMVRPPLFQKAALELRDGLLLWVDAEGQEMARAEGVSIDLTPLKLPSREAVHILLMVDRVFVSGRSTASRLRVELLRSEGVDTLLWATR